MCKMNIGFVSVQKILYILLMRLRWKENFVLSEMYRIHKISKEINFRNFWDIKCVDKISKFWYICYIEVILRREL